MSSGLPFLKMHGLGNDVVVLDARKHVFTLTPENAKAIADRRTGVGCDQIMIIEAPRNGGDAYVAIRNSDGGVVESCGNGSRCVARVLMEESGKTEVTMETLGGPIVATRAGDLYSIDMGPARDDWQTIPLAQAADTLHLPVSEGPLSDGVGVNVGNPHAVFFVKDAAAVDLEAVGPKLEHNALFPARINVEAVQILDRGHVRMRVWERGAGITRACGTGACASAVAAARRGLTDRKVTVTLDGGDLHIEWRDDGHVIMTGPATLAFSGLMDRSLLA
ncbi:MAG: diaminopimelate epimerase [Rhodospirillaceae bacterium]|nr:diaminopimelate epimerase [Rhodospirillaceae bacterium]